MAKKVAIGIQSFEKLREGNYFYVDKTAFIREWWGSGDDVTLITRPRRFGKTMNMSMLEAFFSVDYADRGDLFEGLSIWEDEKYRAIQGTYPVIFLSFANVKEKDFKTTRKKICQLLTKLYTEHEFLLDSGVLYEADQRYFKRVVAAAHAQIKEKQYEAAMIAKGIPAEHIRTYGFAFEGKKVLIG